MLRRFIVAAFCFIPFVELGAQDAQPSGFAVLQGVAVDSVRGGFLRGATVGVLGPSKMAFTDSLGRFRIDSIPPGEYQVALFDPLLDTLALGVVSAPTRFAAGDTVELVLAVPSQLAIVTAKCGMPRGEDDRALFGQILDAATEQPVPGAEVTLNWSDITISEQTGVRSEPRRRQARSDERGHYRICGLPAELTAEASVRRGADSTGTVQIVFGDALLGMATFMLPGSGAVAARDTVPGPAAPAGTAAVSGTVVDDNGVPIENAHVSITGGTDAATTDSSGTFTLSGQPTGTHALVVRRLGFMPVEVAVNLTPLRTSEVAVQMQQHVPVLAAVVIGARREAALDQIGFTRRKARGTGRYIERAEIENRNPHRLSGLLENIPNIRRPGDGFGGVCTFYWVDGVLWRGEGPEDSPENFIMPNEIEAIEVYTRSFVPFEFQTQGYDRCTTVAIWTRWKLRLF